MKVSVTQEKLAKALNLIKDIASSRNELPILNNILLRTDGGRLLIAGTNLEIASTQYIGAKIEDHGSITIPARLVSEFITNLPSGPVELETKNEHLHITSGKFSSVINGVVADEYPELPTIDEKTAMQYEIDVEDLKKAIVQTKLAVSSDVTRAVLTGVYWHNYEGSLYLAATDGYRLAEKRLIKSDNEVSAIIPASTLAEVSKSVGDEKKITVLFDDSQVCFKTGDMEIVSRLIDGKENTSEATAKISADGQVTLNSRYLTEVLNIIDADEIVFSFNGKLSPCVIREQVKNPDYTHIIMPLKS